MRSNSSTDTVGICATVRQFIVDELRGGDAPDDFDEHSNLIEDEVIDSLGIMSLVVFIEEQWSVEIQPEEVTLRNFESLRAIQSLISAKL